MDDKILTPFGSRQVSEDIIKLFQSVPIKKAVNRSSKYKLNKRVYEWLEEDGKMVTKIYPA